MSTREAKASTPRIAPHPAGKRLFHLFVGLSVAPFVLGGLTLLGGSFTFAAEFFALGIGMVASGVWMRGFYDGFRIYAASMQRVARGQLDEAEALLATIPRSFRERGIIGRAVRSQRATIALLRGQVDAAIAEADAAMAISVGWLNSAGARSQQAQILGTRALAYAAKGDAVRAEADAAGVFALDEAAPEALARAAVARAVVLARAGKTEDLGTYLRANQTLLLDRSEPRERVVVRALFRMTRSTAKSVYREPAKPSDEPKANPVTSFVAVLAPEAATFVDDDRPFAAQIDLPDAMPASVAHVDAITRTRAKQAAAAKGHSPRRTLALWGVLVMMFLVIWQFLTPAETGHRPPKPTAEEPQSSEWSATPPIAVGVFGFLLIAGVLANNRRVIRRHMQAQRAAALGTDMEGARRSLWSLANSSQPYIGGWAWYELARLASADAAFVDAAKWCDAGLKRLALPTARAQASDFVLPGLLTELAVAEAALGNKDDAAAELALLARDFRDYAYLPSAAIRVKLVAATRAEDLDAAAAAARERSADLPLPRREELLADLVLAATSTVSEEERRRLAEEVSDPAITRWIDAVAPRLRDRALGQVRVATAATAAEEHDAIADEAAAAAKA